MNKDYSLMYEAYLGLNQSGMAYRQQNDPYRKNNVRTKTDAKNSYANVHRTADLPAGGGGKFSPGALGAGGVSIDNEEEMIEVKGVGKVKRTEAEKRVIKLADEILNLTKRGSYVLIPAKIDLLKSLTDSLG
jgi:hypothetical protein